LGVGEQDREKCFFLRTYCLQIRINMKAAGFSETSLHVYRSVCNGDFGHIPDTATSGKLSFCFNTLRIGFKTGFVKKEVNASALWYAEYFVTSWTSISPWRNVVLMKLVPWKFIAFGDFQLLSLGRVV
jgi:hypothetical protein